MNISLKGISKQYGDTMVLKDFNLEIPEGKITCIMGPSGVGKTTLLHIILGLIKVDAGFVEGTKGKKLAGVFQEDRLCEETDAINNVKLVCNKKVSEERIKQELREVGLCDYENKKVINLSGGMKRRVAIVRAVLADSDIITMDEPFKGLDKKLKEQVIEYVLLKTRGKTVILVTHDKEEVEVLGAELVTINGR